MAVSEHQNFVGPLRPRGELVHGAAMGTLHQIGFGDAARVDAGPADADLGAGTQRHAQHIPDVVIALRHFLQYFLRLNFSLVLMTFFSVT